MSNQSTESRVGRVEILVSYILRGGVALSFAVTLIGFLIMFAHHREYFTSRTALPALVSKDARNIQGIDEVRTALSDGQGRGWVLVGLICLIGTPVLRVIAALVAFGFEKDRAFVVCSAIVLALLCASFLLGHLHGSSPPKGTSPAEVRSE